MNKTPPPPTHNKKWLSLSYMLAGLLLVMSVLQLVNFEAFTLHIATYEISSPANATTVAVSLIAVEVFSLPFLLQLWLSKLARIISATFVVLAPMLWAFLIVQAVARQLAIANTGFFGDMLPLALGPLSVVFSLIWLAAGIACFVALNGRKALNI